MRTETITLQLEAAFDAATVATIRPKFDEIAAANLDVVIDFSKVDFVDSSGVGAIIFLYKRLTTVGRSLTLVGVQGQPLQLMEFLRIPRVIPMRPQVSAA